MRRRDAQPDYHAEGLELLNRVNLSLTGAPARYADSNPIYKHPPTGALLLVGNATCANSREKMAAIECTRIVYCQQPGEGKMSFAKDPKFLCLLRRNLTGQRHHVVADSFFTLLCARSGAGTWRTRSGYGARTSATP